MSGEAVQPVPLLGHRPDNEREEVPFLSEEAIFVPWNPFKGCCFFPPGFKEPEVETDRSLSSSAAIEIYSSGTRLSTYSIIGISNYF
jgi:hypothetical protein